jgi:hypothetical protein
MIDLSIGLEITEPEANTYHLTFANQRDLAHSMMRLQEYYEGPDLSIQGQHFTLEQFLQAYTLPDGTFEYTNKWCGFNVPGEVVDGWYQLFTAAGPLLAKEQQMMDQLLERRRDPNVRWYLIATGDDGDSVTIRHELAHARYYLHEDYRDACDRLVEQMAAEDRRRMAKILIRMGYAEHVVSDEIQAYISTGTKRMLEEMFGEFSEKSQPSIKRLKSLYRKWQP